jgi:hypothetical protein
MSNLLEVADLLNDPLFIEFELDQEAPTIFNAVGRTHTERWHSAFVAWLLDPQGSHGLGDYPLRRFIALLATEDPLGEGCGLNFIEPLANGDFERVKVLPNEREPAEHKEPNVGDFDVYVRGIRLPEHPRWQEVRLLLEVKVGAKIDKAQCAKYISFIEAQKLPPTSVLIVPVFLAPTSYYKDDVSMKDLLGDSSWIGLDYRTLYDGVLYACGIHPKASQFGKILMAEYAKTLRHHSHSQEPLIMSTQNDSNLAQKLFQKHKKAIRTLYAILAEVSDDADFDPDLLDKQSGQAPSLRIKINGVTFEATSVRGLYQKVLEHLVRHGYLGNLQPMPFTTSSERALLSKDRVHPSGKPFWQPVSYGPFFMESNKSHPVALAHLKKLLDACHLDMEEIK